MKKKHSFSKLRRFLGKYIIFWRFLFLVTLVFIVGFVLFWAVGRFGFWAAGLLKGPRMVVSFLESPEENLQFTQGRANVLVLGASGAGQAGADLTDTVIFTSIDIKTGDAVMLSIPRDIWLDSLRAKINTAYHYGEKEQKGSGFVLAKDAVYQVVGQPIHYTFLVDFEGFVKLVNLVGGLNLKIDRTFDDYKYPIPGKEDDDCGQDPELKCRYEHLHFEAGEQEMAGEEALKFVRSRNAEGEEGTDFARAQRQQKVILALKNKIISARFLANPGKLQELIRLAKTYIKSDPPLKDVEIGSFANLLVRFIRQKSQIRTLTLDVGSEEDPGFLVNPPPSEEYQNQWVLLPRSGDWSQFQEYFAQKIENGY